MRMDRLVIRCFCCLMGRALEMPITAANIRLKIALSAYFQTDLQFLIIFMLTLHIHKTWNQTAI